MSKTKQIINLAKENNGIITTAMVTDVGISRGNLKYLVDKGQLEKTARGVYTLPEIWEDEFINLQSRFKRGIFSNETALFLMDMTDRTPNYFCMTFPATYNLTKPKEENVHCSKAKKELYDMGIVLLKTPNGHYVKAYGMERTLCDILKSSNCIDIQIVAEAFKRYTSRKDKNIPLLSQYAKELKVEQRLRAYLEVLL